MRHYVYDDRTDPDVFLAAASQLGVVPPACLALAFPPGAVMATSLLEVSSWMTFG